MKSVKQRNNLVIDVGNTLTKIAVFADDELIYHNRYSTLTPNVVAELVLSYGIGRAIVSSVGELPSNFDDFFPHKLDVLTLSSEVMIPLKNCYKTPETLGVDRLALAVGASTIYPSSNLLVVDCGSAITYDIVSDQEEYLGGAISPGIDMRFKALNTFTAKLPLFSIDYDFPLVGASTKDSIQSGVLNGVINEVDGYISMVANEYPALTVVFTGGNAKFFDKKLKNSIFVHPNLLIFGLNRILNYNE
ncbi:MAG TPA: type III pantothenate kinase [Bacteroidetes bacterium]|nr:type III pantothenate kinase [Bacteroidota bacterium]